MTVTNIIELLGGLGAFLFGMKYMGDGLELAAGSKMKDLLEKLTRNRILGFLQTTWEPVIPEWTEMLQKSAETVGETRAMWEE